MKKKEYVNKGYITKSPNIKTINPEEPERTPEQVCESTGGRLVKKNGVTFCEYISESKYGTSRQTIPLNEVDENSNPFSE